MSMRHPWEALSPSSRWHLLRRTAIVAIGLTFLMSKSGRPLKGGESPLGIVSLELARTSDKARRILDAWSTEQTLVAWRGLQLDFVYLVAYGLALSLACAAAADWLRARGSPWARVATMLAWASLAASVLDAIENVALMLELRGSGDAFLAPIAFVAASVKFTIVTIGLLLVIGTGAARLASGASGEAR